MAGVHGLDQILCRSGRQCRCQRCLGPFHRGGQSFEKGGPVRFDFVAFVAPDACDFAKHMLETRLAVPADLGKIGAAPEGRAIRCQEHGKGPAPMRAQSMDGIHVDLVDIRPLFTVDLDIDEMLVHQLSRERILKALVRHDMAPVAGGIANREEDGLVLCTGVLECGITPWIPVNGVMLVLQQVRAGFVFEEIFAHGQSLARGHAQVDRDKVMSEKSLVLMKLILIRNDISGR